MFEDVTKPEFLKMEWLPQPEKYYCLHCIDTSKNGTGWPGEGGVVIHCDQKHGLAREDLVEGADWAKGADLVLILDNWRRENEERARAFERHAASLVTVEDFLFECSKGKSG